MDRDLMSAGNAELGNEDCKRSGIRGATFLCLLLEEVENCPQLEATTPLGPPSGI